MNEQQKKTLERFCRCEECFLKNMCPKLGYDLSDVEIYVLYSLRGQKSPVSVSPKNAQEPTKK